ncbi:hypothetical protein SLEP1_g36456 [Rubroshorea leprosula]|uniref:Uncharacterized protein n=1 Tax=Rubroshorea leprosula TaxID=152421 RepID=A0AAV5KRH8_9ROSI|nr:hypothetical protein SLEP1_g36456 [Rubroshorea leprosula]
MLVIATKATILQDRYSVNEIKWMQSSFDNSLLRSAARNDQQLPYREYMPSIWQVSYTSAAANLFPGDFFIDKDLAYCGP